MTDLTKAILTIAIASLVTILLRFLPFAIFRGNKKTPKIITYLGKVLPFAIMGMLVVFCLKDISFTSHAGFLPATIAGALVVVLYALTKNTLLGILAGTVCYMVLVQFVFV